MPALLLLSGCAAIDVINDPSPDKFYRREIVLKHEGKTYTGTGVLIKPSSGLYNLEFNLPSESYMIIFKSCHREVTSKGTGKSYKLAYSPVPFLEGGSKACPVEIMSLSETGLHAFGFFDLDDASEKLTGATKCNGLVRATTGVSVCQSRARLVQEISFLEDVQAKSTCAELVKTDDYESRVRAFRYKMPVGRCVMAFKGVSGRWHRHTSVGYDDIILRKP